MSDDDDNFFRELNVLSFDSDDPLTSRCLSGENPSSLGIESTLSHVDFFTELPNVSFDFEVPLDTIQESYSESKVPFGVIEIVKSNTKPDDPVKIEHLPCEGDSTVVNQEDDNLKIVPETHLMLGETEMQHPEVFKENFQSEGTLFSTEMIIKNDMKLHSTANYFICSQCDKHFRIKKYLLRHQNTHLGVKKFVCDICETSFPRKDSFLRHKRNVHSTKDINFRCHLCDTHFSRIDNLARHKLKKHSN